ncbi:hypothetical protein BaRGS_00034794, partial [Batillaria attramentaria]
IVSRQKRQWADHYEEDCPHDQYATGSPGSTCAYVYWTPPPEDTDHHTGPSPGSCISRGSHAVGYSYEGNLGWHWTNGDECNFNVYVTGSVIPYRRFPTVNGAALVTAISPVTSVLIHVTKDIAWSGQALFIVSSQGRAWSGAVRLRLAKNYALLRLACAMEPKVALTTDFKARDLHYATLRAVAAGQVTAETMLLQTVLVVPDFVRLQPTMQQFVNVRETNDYVGRLEFSSLDTAPELISCPVSVTDVLGSEMVVTCTGDRTQSGDQRNGFTNTQPHQLHFVLRSGMNLTLDNFPEYITDARAGIVDTRVTAFRLPVTGGYYTVDTGNFSRLDWMSHPTVPFNRLPSTERVCILYDVSRPTHCSQTVCNDHPLELSSRLTRTPEISAHVDGWTDPVPSGGTAEHASQIWRYRLEVHGVDFDGAFLSVEDVAMENYTLTWEAQPSSGSGPFDLSVRLPDAEPRLYAIILEVHDRAGNVGYARRLVLYDNSSVVELNTSAPMSVLSAHNRSGDYWQTDNLQPICVDWQNRFYSSNDDVMQSVFLEPVKGDTKREIFALYDQTTGILPVTGTDNEAGIVKFELSYGRESEARSAWTSIRDIDQQTVCLRKDLHDGDTYKIWIRASDIMGNSQASRSNDGHKLFVRDLADLSTLDLLVHAEDPHSGIQSVEVTVSSVPSSSDLPLTIVKGRQDVGHLADCPVTGACYCPMVGACENSDYPITFAEIFGNTSQTFSSKHLRVQVNATNSAGLWSTEGLDIFIDETPPSVGVVMEMPNDGGANEINKTLSDRLHVKWEGFADNESGVVLYRFALGQRCMSAEEMNAGGNVTEDTQKTST